MSKFKWTFEPNEPDRREGLNHSGLSFFTGHPFRSLAREMIQNSMDAADGSKRPVRVRVSLRKDIQFGREELRDTFDRCAEATVGREGDDHSRIELGRGILERKRIPCLVVEDYNTVGLAGRRLQLLVKGDGDSYKNLSTSLGSRGIGKHAAFAVSGLYTVLYSSQFVNDETGEVERAFQGKSSLVSHRDGSGRRRGRTGYYGINRYDPHIEVASSRSDIPENMVRSEIGTTVIIVGFVRLDGWETEIIKSVISNFYFAILAKRLEVEVEDEKRRLWKINNQTLSGLFDRLSVMADADDAVIKARDHFRCIADAKNHTQLRPPTQSGQLPSLGHCMAWIEVGEGLPRTAEFVREPGMVICDAVRNFPRMIKLPGHWSDFAAVVLCGSERGNSLLKRMEPPEHDKFQPELLLEEERQLGVSALRELGGKIHDWLDYMMPTPKSDDPQPVDELAEFFPSDDETIEGGGSEEIDPFGAVKVGGVKERLPVLRPQTPEFVESEVEDEIDDYEPGDGTRSNGGGGGSEESERGKRRKRRTQKAISISDVRFAPAGGNDVTVWFTANDTVTAASLALRIGSEERAAVDSIRVCALSDGAGNAINQGEINADSGERVSITLTTEDPFPADRALIIDVTTERVDK